MAEIKTMQFRKQTLLLVEHAGKPFVVMRPIVESMGLDWSNCFLRLKKRFSKAVTKIRVSDAQGRKQKMTCLALAKYPAWLSLVNPDNVSQEVREDLLAYQSECEQVFVNHYQRKALGGRHG